MSFQAKVLADSINPQGVRLTTLELTFPRCILAEFNTHRMISRNAASSRAIPTEKLIQRVVDNPFIPEFALNKKGMQAGDALDEGDAQLAKDEWLASRDFAVAAAQNLHALDCHKQYVNRLLEPWMWVTVIASATEWNNLFHLRCNPDAEPSFQKIAWMAYDAMQASTPQSLVEQEWHLPLIDIDVDHPAVENYLLSDDWNDPVEPTKVDQHLIGEYLAKVSVGRCARVSYLTHDGKRDVVADIELHDRLAKSGHWSPFEHVATPIPPYMMSASNFRGWFQYRKDFSTENVYEFDPGDRS
ncbi:MAG TPA: FAD-dependent thymidylate synthase [Fimbriimonas sp.]|nr:FAD-dependent thymidylate synthase [Fimbriimonas sp.]